MKFLRVSLVAFVVVTASAQIQSNTSRDAFFAAVRRGAADEVERLLKSGLSPNVTDADGTPALMSAILFGDARLVELLLKRGADADQRGPAGTTALMWAVPESGEGPHSSGTRRQCQCTLGNGPHGAARGFQFSRQQSGC